MLKSIPDFRYQTKLGQNISEQPYCLKVERKIARISAYSPKPEYEYHPSANEDLPGVIDLPYLNII
jgi:hypothetical protein